uniref:Uncharacterized protein n=1 Tax=Timema poppense TaxID=170557 RepID=A0A7R9D2A3_TIMPO|nr:unnamed protein product [Timema poppensis]
MIIFPETKSPSSPLVLKPVGGRDRRKGRSKNITNKGEGEVQDGRRNASKLRVAGSRTLLSIFFAGRTRVRASLWAGLGAASVSLLYFARAEKDIVHGTRSIMESALNMLLESRLPETFCAKSVNKNQQGPYMIGMTINKDTISSEDQMYSMKSLKRLCSNRRVEELSGCLEKVVDGAWCHVFGQLHGEVGLRKDWWKGGGVAGC